MNADADEVIPLCVAPSCEAYVDEASMCFTLQESDLTDTRLAKVSAAACSRRIARETFGAENLPETSTPPFGSVCCDKGNRPNSRGAC